MLENGFEATGRIIDNWLIWFFSMPLWAQLVVIVGIGILVFKFYPVYLGARGMK